MRGSQPIFDMDASHGLYGNVLGVQFVFRDRLDADILRRAVDHLVAAFPALAGRPDFKAGQVVWESGAQVPLGVQEGAPGEAGDYIKPGRPDAERFSFVNEPTRRQMQSGRAPLSAFLLTIFKDGGCILGITMSHLIVDGAGFHMAARYLSAVYEAMRAGEPVPKPPFAALPKALRFGTRRSKAQVQAALKSSGLPKPLYLKGILGGLWKTLIMKTMETNRKTTRAVFHLTAAQVGQLKQTVLAESGEDWISTHAALGAHFARIMAQLQFGGTPKLVMQIAQVLDLRGRYFDVEDETQARYPGNAILIYTDKGEFGGGFQNTPRGEIARFMKASLAELTPKRAQSRLDLTEDAIRAGYTYPGLDIRSPMIAVNNQSKMDVYAAHFGHDLGRVIPQDVGDHIMVYPAKDGGVEVYLRDLVKAGRQSELYQARWRGKIYDV